MEDVQEKEMKPCPFCGREAIVITQDAKFQIVGCSNRRDPTSNMLCPNPSIIVYANENGEYDYRWWNRRTP